ncbi:MAG: hypothetical protein AABZ00_19460 [Chloroflexota bacterium]
MNAWLITWEGTQLYKSNLDKIVAILSSRKPENRVKEFIQLLYLRSTSNASQMAYVANRPKEITFNIHEAPSNNGILYPGRFFCGSSQFMIYARQVTNLKIYIDKEKQKEVLTWTEPSTYRLKENGYDIELASEGESGNWERDSQILLSKDTW